MGRPGGFWHGAVKPDLERKVEQQLLSQAMMKKKPTRPTLILLGAMGRFLPTRFLLGED